MTSKEEGFLKHLKFRDATSLGLIVVLVIAPCCWSRKGFTSYSRETVED